MSKNVLIKICGIQKYRSMNDEADEPIEVTTEGTYEIRDGMHVLEYDEFLDGAEDLTHNQVIVNEDEVTVYKTGAVNVNMDFKEGITSISRYETPYGLHELEIMTKSLKFEPADNGLNADIKYILSLNGNYLADCFITYKVIEK